LSELIDHRAAAGVTNEGLRALLEDHWEWALAENPVWASRLGDRRFDDRLPGTSPEDHDARRRMSAEFLKRTTELVAPEDELTHRLFSDQMESSFLVESTLPEWWSIQPRNTPVSLLGWLPQIRPIETEEEEDALLARYHALPDYVDGILECLEMGASIGRFANRESVRRAVELVRAEIAKAEPEWGIAALPVREALRRFADFLEKRILPHGREGGEVGIHALPGGPEAYAEMIRQHTTLNLSPEEIHETGLQEMAAIHAEFEALGGRDFDRLRTDPALYFETAEEVEEKAQHALDAARAAMPDWFGRLPKADCVVKRIPDHEAPYTTIAYYRPPSGDGTQPGEYRINVHAPETRPRHEARALAFHESIPGHHLQIAIAMELAEMPAFRRLFGVTSYVEGWALYTERLADEMGLYTSDTDRLGMLSFDAWRASRLVVDTGIHAFGWSRERAIEYMVENTPLARNNIDNEVDRYICWPGQALAYKIGQIAFRRLRRDAETELGDRFDIQAYHDVLLGSGPVTLDVLEEMVREFIGG
jgi:uncharacterized protein (DUF885 family)